MHNTEHPTENAIYWRCRRGKLELDLLLIPFFEACYEGFSKEEKTLFEALLSEQDPDLYAYLMGEKECEDAAHQTLINQIRRYHAKIL